LDHQPYLGDTLSKILDEKMGILRPESLVFTGIEDPALLEQLEKKCAELDAVYYYSKELRVAPSPQSPTHWNGQTFQINDFPFRITNPSPGARKNAALAFLFLRICFPKIPVSLVQKAFAEVVNPGRMEVMQENPRVILSGDHNPAGIECLRETIQSLKPHRLLTLCAFSPDKPYQQMWQAISAFSDETFLTQVSRLKQSTAESYKKMAPLEPEPLRALENILARSHKDDTILVTGSLYLVGELRRFWQDKCRFC
jgi:dihydrofolate synthase/folylpolyglutamate synthase